MGPVGWPEMMFIGVLALLLFGPKKLPELGRMLAKGLTEFRRASAELRSTFDVHMRELERETQGIKEATNTHYQDSYNYEYPSYDSGSPYDSALHGAAEVPALPPSPTGASEVPGAELPPADHHEGMHYSTPENIIASGSIEPNGTPAAIDHGAAEQEIAKS